MDWKVRALTLVLWLGLVLTFAQNGNAEKRVVCYYTNWSVYRPGTAKFSPQNINPYLCTHLIYAFGGFTKDNTLKPFDKYQDIEKGGYAKFTGLKTYNKNLKTLLAIGGWNEGSSRFSPMVADAKRRKEFVKNCVKFLRQNHFDGLDLDWEYPAFRDGGKPRDKENYAILVEELREQFDRESLKTGRPRLLLTMAMPAGIEYIDKGYDVPRLNENLDFINLLSYDYHSAFEPAVNHHSPLYPLEEDNEYNYDTELTIEFTINHLIKQGASPEKIVLGIPTYGRSYTLFNEDSTEIGSPADGPGIEGDATREKGYLAYYEICENVQKDDWEVVQPNPEAMGPYAFRENQWVGYDDENIVRVKAQYVNEKKLGGIMFWSIDNDDFRGKCHGRPYPLIEAAKEALLAGSSKGEETKEKPALRKATRTQSSQSNSSGRQYASSNRRTSTTEASTRKRISSLKSKTRSNARTSRPEEDEEDSLDDEEDDRNALKIIEKPTRARINKNRSRIRSSESGGRRKQKNRDSRPAEDSKVEESLGNKLTTPEPPTTPDPGSDFKCEDEGFFPHPRDCKKYFWCLDSGPSGLGVVAHQFTCPSGLVFNKGADSCDYPRNVVCPKVKSGSETTTKAPTTTTRSTTRRTTTEKPELEEEYDYEDEEEEEEEEKELPKSTAKPLLYKTISRNRPSSTTVSPTTKATTTTTTTKQEENPEKSLDLEEEEDPRVIKELIDLIKKAGGIEQLEKQLLFQEKPVGGQSGTTIGSGQVTPATISRSLYERVLNRQASKANSRFFGTSPKPPENKVKDETEGNKRSRIGYQNGPGRAQFDGLDDLPEVKSLRRTNKPQYITIERSRSSPSERIDENEDEEDKNDNADVASSEERSISNPPEEKILLPKVTPSYVNIRRNRPVTPRDNDVNVKGEEEIEEEKPSSRRHFPIITTRTEKSISDIKDPKPQRNSTGDHYDEFQSPTESEQSVKRRVFPNRRDEEAPGKSRYISIQRFRSTTERQEKSQTENQRISDVTTQTNLNTFKDTTTLAPGSSAFPYTVSMTYSQSSSSSSSQSTSPLTTTSTTITTTENPTTQSITIHDEPLFTTKTLNPTVSSPNVKLVEDTATEILLTTLPSTNSPTTRIETTTKENLAAVSQPRPFGFTRGRSRATVSSSFLDSTTPLSSATVPSRSKVSTSSRNFARSSNTNQTRSRARSRVTTESSSRVSDRFKEEAGYQEASTPVSRFRSRTRGSARNREETGIRNRSSEEIGTRSRSPEEINPRSRSRATTIAPSTKRNQSSRRGRRPTSKSNIGRGSRNELDDSPIIRISQDDSQVGQSRRSRRPGKSVEEAQITNLRIFKESADPRSRNRAGSRRFEDSTAQASIRDLSETTSAPRLEEETFFSPSSSYNFAKTTGTYLRSTEEKEGWTGLNSIHPYYSTDLGVNTVTFPSISTVTFPSISSVTFPSISTEFPKSTNFRRKFTTPLNESPRTSSTSSTTESTSSRRRISLLRRRTGLDTSTAATEENLHKKRRKVIRRLRPLEVKSNTTNLNNKTSDEQFPPRSTTPIIPTDSPSEFGTFTTEKVTENFYPTPFFNEFNSDTTEVYRTTLLDQINESRVTNPVTDYSTSFETFPTSTFPTTLNIPDDLTTIYDSKTTFNYRTSPILETSNLYTSNLDESSKSYSPKLDEKLYETTSPLPGKITDSQNSRFKYSRRVPHPTSGITNARRFPALSSTTPIPAGEIDQNALAKRRKHLFIRRRQGSLKTQTEPEHNPELFVKTGETQNPKNFNFKTQDSTSKTQDSGSFRPDDFWKSFNTVRTSLNWKGSTDDPTQSLNLENSGPVYRRPEYRPILRTSPPESLQESTNNDSNNPNFRSTLSIYRKPRVRVEEPNENDEPKFRFYPKQATTEQSVTETLIPAKKFDYIADAFLRKQTQRGSSRSKTKEENENLVDVYSTTPSSKPQITRLVTSVVESATTERQKILIRRKYSQLMSAMFFPQTTTGYDDPTSFSLKSKEKKKESNEIQSESSTEAGIEKSTLPIESAFLKNGGKFTTESSGESSTIEIESVFNNLISSSRDSRQ